MQSTRSTRLPAAFKDEHRLDVQRFKRGVQRWSNFPQWGAHGVCACGEWERRHNGPQSELRQYHRLHMVQEFAKQEMPRAKHVAEAELQRLHDSYAGSAARHFASRGNEDE